MMKDYAEYISRNHDKSKILRYMNLLWGLWGRDINRAALFIEEMVCHSGNGSKTIYIDPQKEKWLKEWLKDKQNAIYLKTGSIMLLKDFIEYIINGKLADSEILEYIKNYADKQELRNRLVQEHFAIRTIGETEIGITDDGKPLYKKGYFTYRNMPFDDVLYRLEKAVSFVDEEINVPKEQIHVEPHQREQIADARNVITERAKKYFDKAIEINYMVQTTDGYKWKWGEPKGKVRLAYFLRKIYNYDGCGKIPFKGLERLFNVSGLNTSLYQLDGALPPKWIKEIDKIFND